jgi:hypothetical protein
MSISHRNGSAGTVTRAQKHRRQLPGLPRGRDCDSPTAEDKGAKPADPDQADDPVTLYKQFQALYGQGKYMEAATIAERFLKLIEAARGPMIR